jgi:hypothetical protein
MQFSLLMCSMKSLKHVLLGTRLVATLTLHSTFTWWLPSVMHMPIKSIQLASLLLPAGPAVTHPCCSVSPQRRVARLKPFLDAGFRLEAALAAPYHTWLSMLQVGGRYTGAVQCGAHDRR